MKTKNAWTMGLIALALVACGGGEEDTVDSGRPDAGGAVDAGGGDEDGGGGGDVDGGGGDVDGGGDDVDGGGGDVDGGGDTFVAFSGCEEEADYTSAVTSVTTAGLTYQPPCLRVAVGTSVEIEASAVHPLGRRAGGAADSPIPETATTSTGNYTFAAPGFYPYRCTAHEAAGMVGVIWAE